LQAPRTKKDLIGRYILINEEEARTSWGDDIARYYSHQIGGYIAG